ncbi:uncharacterized protein ATNIH1004_008871 [Aspergillus tanneri]|uniref:Uncharacterized protein n=1 Tax=Aspergillus tanneri TaxID=1220188 RepID=A0A5M9MCE3_9EURO|nr:uncharacterized protein ATNIH1004_008871 [Aspergillus tanneri]KAA8644665.1 hypothetical protein ATNIH1004_008871 [Aspergillus tanneri]
MNADSKDPDPFGHRPLNLHCDYESQAKEDERADDSDDPSEVESDVSADSSRGVGPFGKPALKLLKSKLFLWLLKHLDTDLALELRPKYVAEFLYCAKIVDNFEVEGDGNLTFHRLPELENKKTEYGQNATLHRLDDKMTIYGRKAYYESVREPDEMATLAG